MRRREAATEWFIRTVAEGDTQLDSSTIDRLAGELDIQLGESAFCAAVRYTCGDMMTAAADKPVSLYNACVQAGRRLAQGIHCYIGAHFYVVMVISDNGADRENIITALYGNIAKHSTDPVQIGVGRSYRDAGKLSYSRVEAYESLASMDPAERISYIDDIYVTRSITTRKLESEKRRVIEHFKTGELDQMLGCMVQLAENIRKESPVREGMPYPTSIRRTIVELLFEIMHISADAGVDVDPLLNYQDPYTRAFEIDDTPEILAWFFDIASVLYDSISELSNKTENNMLTLAKKCIEEHLQDPELSLSLVSDNLGITPTYFSAFFIREVGMGFNEYITGLRVEQAKQMLAKTSKKINTIASECGFRSASYFIVVFRKQTGMSPGEYRNKK